MSSQIEILCHHGKGPWLLPPDEILGPDSFPCACLAMQYLLREEWLGAELPVVQESGYINEHDVHGWTLLLCAAAKNDAERTIDLIQSHADVNQCMEFVKWRHQDIVPYGATPLWIVVEKGHNIALAAFLLQFGAKMRPNPPLSQTGEIVWRMAREIAKEQREERSAMLQAKGLVLTKVLREVIADYMGPPAPTPIVHPVVPKENKKRFWSRFFSQEFRGLNGP